MSRQHSGGRSSRLSGAFRSSVCFPGEPLPEPTPPALLGSSAQGGRPFAQLTGLSACLLEPLHTETTNSNALSEVLVAFDTSFVDEEHVDHTVVFCPFSIRKKLLKRRLTVGRLQLFGS